MYHFIDVLCSPAISVAYDNYVELLSDGESDVGLQEALEASFR